MSKFKSVVSEILLASCSLRASRRLVISVSPTTAALNRQYFVIVRQWLRRGGNFSTETGMFNPLPETFRLTIADSSPGRKTQSSSRQTSWTAEGWYVEQQEVRESKFNEIEPLNVNLPQFAYYFYGSCQQSQGQVLYNRYARSSECKPSSNLEIGKIHIYDFFCLGTP